MTTGRRYHCKKKSVTRGGHEKVLPDLAKNFQSDKKITIDNNHRLTLSFFLLFIFQIGIRVIKDEIFMTFCTEDVE